MKEYVAFLLHMMIWSSFSLIEWLSGRDRPFFKGMMLCVFLYMAFLLARKLGLRTRKAFWTTALTAVTYFTCQHFVWEAFR
ncbi:hypothetical protein HT574_02330 [Parageobacillus sp. VR-IP]|jgi:hypothetical protein|uniref:Uncharacterized protein n=2 Tax=Saccharococcus caldoxylosilyticus TaxID=81408 RepID=A0A023DCQ4_9BACL|nr:MULTISPECIES: hypothetical protein [Parageobacillus]OQP01771.1 hypothetical protein BSK33_11625 [Geobacillus sp. 44B]KYD07315.1 hypothetical protein B4119_1227 [Parageobacillus caldoxylosilyticus]MBB3851716.1 hypothetical protein [Parageobacillus caldoxylosilyticus]NUK28968.1 hypothetical protein [Parageobacillus sp. VR-IP]QNU37917.1 hypothetical protein IC801_00685 [Geobacillus sp. 44B]